MKLDVDAVCRVPAADVLPLSDLLLRFRFLHPRAPSETLQFILDEGRPMETLFPEALDRGAVEHNVRQLRKTLDRAFERERANLRSWKISSTRDYAELNVRHHCRPTLLYTNGQAAASLVEREAGGIEAVIHKDIRRFLSFCDEYGIPDFIRGDQARTFGTLVEAELWIQERLSQIEVSIVPMFRGDSSASLFLQRVGERPGAHGYRETIFSVMFFGERGTVSVGGAHEAYRVLNELQFDGFRVKGCATCRNFRFSGMSRDMSNGSTGYCSLHKNSDPRNPLVNLVVSVYDLCPSFDFVEDAKRPSPYLSNRAR